MQTTKPETAQQRPTGARMALLMLLYFIKIGAFTFGSGWSIIAQMEREFVDERGWMTKSDLLELIAVARACPASWWRTSLCSSLSDGRGAGRHLRGHRPVHPRRRHPYHCDGHLRRIKDNYWVWSALKGVQCAVAPIIGGAAISLGKDALTSAMPIIICAVAFVLCYFTSISNLTLVVAGVVIALVWMGVSEHGHV